MKIDRKTGAASARVAEELARLEEAIAMRTRPPVPAVGDGYRAARDRIVEKVEQLVSDMARR